MSKRSKAKAAAAAAAPAPNPAPPPRKPGSAAPAAPAVGWLRWAPWIVAALAVLVYANTFKADYTLDDVPIIKENQQITSLRNIPTFFRQGYWATADESYAAGKVDNYRPLTVTTYALSYAVHGRSPAGYHVANVVLHALASALLFVLIRAVWAAPRMAFVAALLFAVHPLHTEAVAGMVGRAEMLALLGILGCGYGYERARQAAAAGGGGPVWGWMAVSLLAYLAGMFSKENGVVAPALIFLWEVLSPSRRWLFKRDWRAVALFGGYVLALGLFLAMRPSGPEGAWTVHEGWAGVKSGPRVLTALRVCAEYVGLLVAPVRLSADYWTPDVPIARSALEPGVLLALALFGGAVALVVWSWRRAPAVAWGLGVFALALFPTSNLPFAIGVLKAERLLYTPSAGFLVAVAALLPLLWARPNLRKPAWALVWVAVVLASARTWVRNEDWRDNRALAQATLRTCPTSPTFNTILGGAHRERKENARARELYLKALETRPKDASGWFNVGNIELDEQRYDAAIEHYQKALALRTNHFDALNNMGMAYYHSQRLPQAAEIFKRLQAMRPESQAVYMNLVSAYVQMGQLPAALPVAEEAARRFPNSAGVYFNLATVYQGLGRTNEARPAFERAMQLDPSIRDTPHLKGKL